MGGLGGGESGGGGGDGGEEVERLATLSAQALRIWLSMTSIHDCLQGITRYS